MMIKKSSAKSRVIAHHLPHRTRIKLPRSHRDAATIKKVTDSIRKVSTVKDVQINDRTGSVVVYHEEDTKILEHINGALGEVAGEVLEALIEAEGAEFPGLSLVGTLVSSFMGKADDKLADATNNVVDLKIMMPLAFLGAGFYQASRNAAWLSQVPAWVLFYFAYDSYTRFHGPGNLPGSERANIGDAAAETSAANVEVEQTTKKVTRVTQTGLKQLPNSGVVN
jgi:Heavy metal associated domain 2